MIKERVTQLRELMKKKGLDYWIISGSDPHMSEYVAERWQSRAWISGFTGSAGWVLITHDMAGLWTDSRYFLQASQQLDPDVFTLFKSGLPETPTLEQTIKKYYKKDEIVGFDGTTLSVERAQELMKQLNINEDAIKYDQDLLDVIWEDRPLAPATQIMDFSVKFSGESREFKLQRLRKRMISENIQFHLLTSLDDIAWLMNIRATDIMYNPVAISFCIVGPEQCRFCTNLSRIPEELQSDLKNDGVDLVDYSSVNRLLANIPADTNLYYNPKKVQMALMQNIPESVTLISGLDMTTDLKAEKNEVEIQGMRDAHIQDAVAMLRWWMWLEENIGKIDLDEVSIGKKMAEFRSKGKYFQALSFAEIAGYKGNGAIIHYSASPDTAASIYKEGILLLDSGGHYLNGTTDVTRTFNLGTAAENEKKHYTLVLKGHINLASAVFPEGTSGCRLETLARHPIWKAGLNYGHGTGHGVGHYLNVHEGPAGFSPLNHVSLKKGMILSNEPGLYFENEYGIRIENMVVINNSSKYPGFLEFEDLTVFPHDVSLIDLELLNEEEKMLINDYHDKVRNALKPFLIDEEKEFLEKKTPKI